MQFLLILVVLMIVMCMFNKTRETFSNFKEYGRFENAYCKLTNIKPETTVTWNIRDCRDKCDKNDKCEGFNASKRGNKYVCMYSTNDMKHCGNYKNRPQANGSYYFFKMHEKEAGTSNNQCDKIARDKVLGFRKAAIEAIMNIE